MLAGLWLRGFLVVARREAGRRWWDLAERWLPAWTPRNSLSERQVVRQAAQRSLRALGVGRPRDIDRHFIAGRYPGLPAALARLEHDRLIERVQVREGSATWPGTWYVHADDLATVDRLEDDGWEPRTTLLSPFDNLIRDRDRTRLLFGFDYSIEIYTPAAKRKFGYYVLPILHGDRLVGRVDPIVDRKQRALSLRAIHAEHGKVARESGDEIANAIQELAVFIGADAVTLFGPVPALWGRAF